MAMTREQYPGTQPQRGRTRLKAFCTLYRKKDTRRADAPSRLDGFKGELSLNVGGTTKYAQHTLVP